MILNLRQLNLNLLLVFDALMQEQNLSRAAVRLNMSQPAVSNALSRLREQLGEPLFTRTSRGLVPTVQARAMYEPIRQALQLLQTGLGPQAHFDPSADHVFKLAMNDYGQAHWLPVLMARIRTIAPQVVLSVHDVPAESIYSALATGNIDVAMDYLYLDHADLRYQPLMQLGLVVVGRKRHPAFKGGLTLARYLRCQHVSIHPRAGRGSPLEIVMGSAKARRDVRLFVPHYLAIPAIVARTDLLGVIPAQLAAEFADTYELEVAPVPVEMGDVQVSMIWHQQRDLSAANRWLREQVQAVVSEQLASA